MRRTGAQTVALREDEELILSARLARLCNTTPWEIDSRPAEEIRPYVELLAAIDRANQEISRENGQRAKKNDAALLRRITLAD